MQGTALTDDTEPLAQFLVRAERSAGAPVDPASSPFVIGVTGHRNLRAGDLASVRCSVRSFFDAIRKQLPDTELTVLLDMSAGGDLIVAETALGLGIRVEAMLPMPLDDFVVDFDDANRRLLQALLAHQDLHCIELPQPANRPATSQDTPAWRETAYRNFTEVLIRKSNLMLALWDGRPSQRPGGTTETVLRWLRVRANQDWQSLEFTPGDSKAATDSPFVYWMPIAPQANDEDLAATPPCYLSGLGDTIQKFGAQPPEALQRRLEEFNEYNRDFGRVGLTPRTAACDCLLTKVPSDLLGEDRARLSQISAEYGKADTLALHYQTRSDRLFGMFGIFAFAMGFLYLIYDKLGENQEVLVAYLMILLGSLLLYRLLYTKVWFVKHLRYRALAESLRVTFYLCLAGVANCVDAAELLALSGIEHFEGFGWLGYALKNVAPASIPSASRLDPRRIDYVRSAWVDDQRRYFSRKIAQLEHRSRRVSQWQMAAVVVTVAVLMARMLFTQSLRTMYVSPGVPLKNLLMLVAGSTALFLGAWKLHQSKMATRELIWQYKNQLTAFSRSSAELECTATPDRRTEILVELGKRSLMESYLWTIHRYHREHAPPAGA